jgi:hypothetical protein
MPYRDPTVSADDIVVLRTAGSPSVYQLHHGRLASAHEQFASFEHAAVRGDEVARTHKVRLFYIDSPNAAPFLLRDYTQQP